MSSRLQFVDDHRGAFGVKRLCRILTVSRSGLYRWLAGVDARAERARADAEFAERITEIHTESDGTYGAPRVTAEPRDEGERVNHKRVACVMRKLDIIGLHQRGAHDVNDAAARVATQDPHLGPWEGTLRPCPVRSRHRDEGVLRRSALALATTDEREHERAAAAVLSDLYWW